MVNRHSIVGAVLDFKISPKQARSDLAKVEWDYEGGSIVFMVSYLVRACELFLEREISASQIEEWAEFIECRDDIDFSDEFAKEIMHALANPSLNFGGGEVDAQIISDIKQKIQEQI